MARYEKTGRMYRVIEMLRNARNGLHISEIARDLECSEKTARRYLQALQSEAMYPVFQGDNAGRTVWRLDGRENCVAPIPVNLEEITSLIVAGKVLSSTGAPSVFADGIDSVLQKIKSQRPREMRRLVNVANRVIVSQGAQDALPTESVPWCQAVIEAIGDSRLIVLDYRNGKGEVTRDRSVAPLALCISSGTIYLVGYCYLRKEIRQFVPARILRLEVTRNKAEGVPAFDPTEYAESFFGAHQAEPAEVLIRLTAGLAGYFLRKSAHPSQEIVEEDGGFFLKMRIGANRELVRWIARFGPGMVVLEPLDLREQVRSFHARALERYDADKED